MRNRSSGAPVPPGPRRVPTAPNNDPNGAQGRRTTPARPHELRSTSRHAWTVTTPRCVQSRHPSARPGSTTARWPHDSPTRSPSGSSGRPLAEERQTVAVEGTRETQNEQNPTSTASTDSCSYGHPVVRSHRGCHWLFTMRKRHSCRGAYPRPSDGDPEDRSHDATMFHVKRRSDPLG